MFVASDRNTDVKFDFFDMDFNWLDIQNIHPNSGKAIKKPEHFEEMKAFAAKGLKTPFKIDYFATSLPLLLIFEDDLEAVKNEKMRTLSALAEEGLRELV